MKSLPSKNVLARIIFFFATLVLFVFTFILFCSFKSSRAADDFLKQLGISKTSADEKITNGILDGYVDLYGVKNAKNILLGNRKAVVLDLLSYTKKQMSSPTFIKEYTAMKERAKPVKSTVQTPEEMKADEIAAAKKFITDTETSIKKADATMKPIYENMLVEARKNLTKAEDPNNKHHVAYAKNYNQLLKDLQSNYDMQIANWERKYPTNHLLYVKMRLLQFMDETKDVDFSADLVTKSGKKYFVKREYESKSSRWKMAFRAGKEVVEPAREFVQNWINEIQ